MDIVLWLRSLGLGKYEAQFRENDIDETVLLTLTAADLKELGVTSFGHRRKLLAIVKMILAGIGEEVGPLRAGAAREERAQRHEPQRARSRQVPEQFPTHDHPAQPEPPPGSAIHIIAGEP